MRHAHVAQRRRFERVLAILSAFAVLMSLMVMYAPAALAHHPEISANQTCADGKVVIAYESVSWRTDGGSGSGHSDIRIEVRVGGSGSWTEVDSDAYTSTNGYRFSGTFDGEPYWGSSIEVRARANGPWDNGLGGGETRTTSSFVVNQDCFNPSCPSEYQSVKIEPVRAGTHGTYFTISNINDGASGPTFDWSSTRPVFKVIVKGGPGANIYDYSGATSDQGLHAPLNPSNDQYYGLSHVTLCYGDPEPEHVEVTPVVEVCQVNQQGVPEGEISFAIDPASGATVKVYTNANFTGQVGGSLGDGQTLSLAPGTYYWRATAANSDYELKSPSQGDFTIEPCSASSEVIASGCAVNSNGAALGSVEVQITPDSGATVVISGPGGPYNFSGDGGSIELAPGSYSWQATAGSGFALSGPTSGNFDIDPCEASVSVSSGVCVIDSAGNPSGSVKVVIDPDSGATVVVSGPGGPHNFTGGGGSKALAPGSYSWSATAGPGFALTGASTGEFEIEPCDVSVLVAGGECEVVDGPRGSVTAFIDAASGATVTVYDDELNVVATFSGTGGTSDLPPGSYTWTATPGSGFEFPEGQETSGEFTIIPCEATVIVSHGNCVVDAPTDLGSVTVVIDPGTAAIVTILDSGDEVAATFDGAGGSVALAPGGYTWSAVSTEGFSLSGATSGAFTVEVCDEVLDEVIENDDTEDDEVLDLVVLPFTGADSETLLGVSVALLLSGGLLIRSATRREES